MLDKGILTIAIGKRYYNQAILLAKSAILNSPYTLRAIVTDKPEYFNGYFDYCIKYNEPFANAFKIKLQLMNYSPFEKTLFIDSDSLIINSVENVFTFLNNDRFFVSPGLKVMNGIWYNINIFELINKIGLSYLYKLNSGFFAFIKNKNSEKLFEKANFFYNILPDLGFDYFRENIYPDEPALSLSLAFYNIEPFNDFNRFSRTLINKNGKVIIDIPNRRCFFKKGDEFCTPNVIHFAGRYGRRVYLREKIKLNIYFYFGINNIFSKFFSQIIYFIYTTILLFKNFIFKCFRCFNRFKL
ncbi:MAG: hypothetical protein GYA62_06980 [Bacteroidales bacterium]|nr:hypothetical protein [Bacteroidales bacterium]